MLLVISPAKKLIPDYQKISSNFTNYEFSTEAEELISVLRDYSPAQISKLMNISADLGQLNYERYHTWQKNISPENGLQALMMFRGDVYQGIDVDTLTDTEIQAAQKHLRILSGLYGLLKPLDLILPYRLEMGTKLENPHGKNLYEFWGDKITLKLKEAIDAQGDNILVNLASSEYFKSVKTKILGAKVITPVFKDYKNGTFKVISFYAKKARGLMVRYILQNNCQTPDDLKSFDADGYAFNPELSKGTDLVFTR